MPHRGPAFTLYADNPVAAELLDFYAENLTKAIETGRRPITDRTLIDQLTQAAGLMREWRLRQDELRKIDLFQSHNVTTVGDEYLCTCGVRWGRDEGHEHP